MNTVKNIGKSGLYTSFIIKKKLLKSFLKNGGMKRNDCQEKIDSEINSDIRWIQVKKILQNIDGKDIATILANIETEDVVLKIQSYEMAKREYEIQEKLKELSGFIHFDCFFTCEIDKEYIKNFSVLSEWKKLCKTKSEINGIIIMPYYKKESLEKILKEKQISNNDILKKIFINVIINITYAFQNFGFVHNDLFTKNIIINENNEPVIIDFEKSKFNDKYSINRYIIYSFWTDIESFFMDISRMFMGDKLMNVFDILMMKKAYSILPSQDSIKDIIDLIYKL
jgi:serine/threonine protein kinase